VSVVAEGTTTSVAGTLFGDKPRIISIDGVPTEAELTPQMLLVRNQDKPGFIGNLGRALGDAQVNIANFHNGRIAATGQAICLVGVDHHVDEAVLRKIAALPNVVQAKLLTF
jgi:D-3-phosphoglycerate dehydrogenase